MVTLITVLLGMLVVAFKAESVEASGTIYIRADGSIDPSCDRYDVTETFTS